ncbi:hypothetical protein GOV08_01965 [Candidatus Woesearchaeota archaeon]|nr:hypothetical protein [Candidatus Woesearchaeota archaeon]
MNEKQASELLIEYEDLILGLSNKLLWLLRTNHGKKYQFAVMNDMHNKTIEKLEKAHEKLMSYVSSDAKGT